MSRAITLRLERSIAASRAAAWDAFTEAAQVSKWFMTDFEADLRPGGRYRNADGDTGEYIEVEPPSRVAFTWENPGHCPGTLVTVTLEEHEPERADLALEHAGFASDADREEMRGGWSWALDSFVSYLETGSPIPHEEWLNR